MPGLSFAIGFVLDIIATPRPACVRIDGVDTPFEWTSERSGTLTVTVPAGNGRRVEIR